MKFFINMHKINSLCIVVFLLTINSFSQSESNQETVNDSIISLSDTDDVVDLVSISLSDDELNDDTSVSDNISWFVELINGYFLSNCCLRIQFFFLK